MASRGMRIARWALVGASVLLIAVDHVIVIATPVTPGSWPVPLYLAGSAAAPAFPVVGALIASRRPHHRVGWLLLAFGVIHALHLATQSYRDLAVLHAPGDWPAGVYAAWGSGLALIAKMALLVFVIWLYPDGRLPSRLWRWLVSGITAYVAVNLTAFALAPGPLAHFSMVDNPFGVPGRAGDLLRGYVESRVGAWVWPAALLLGAICLAARYRRSGWRERQQIKWFLVGAVVVALAVAMVVVTLGQAPQEPKAPAVLPLAAGLVLLASVALPAAIGYALLRHQLLDIKLAVSRSLLYGVLAFAIAAAYFGGAAALGITAGGSQGATMSVLITVLAIVVFQPLRRRLDRAAAHLVYGRRLSGYDLLTQLGAALEHAFDPTELASKVSATVRDGLRLHWARVVLEVHPGDAVFSETLGAVGIAPDDETPPQRVAPLRHADQTLGAIECGPKTDGRFSGVDERLLDSLARQAAVAFHNSRLATELAARLDELRRQAAELERSRRRIVQAQVTERRRLERDVHDGVQQEIVALMAKATLARKQLRRAPELADATLAELQDDVQRALDSIRELARGIHPAVLTDQGLAAAVESLLGRVPADVSVELDAGGLGGTRLDDPVEAAAYFVVAEAVTNALKHAEPQRVRVALGLSGGLLRLDVEDDGRGFVPAEAAGTGVDGMRDRVEAVRGRLTVRSEPEVGTRVAVEMPVTVRTAVMADDGTA